MLTPVTEILGCGCQAVCESSLAGDDRKLRRSCQCVKRLVTEGGTESGNERYDLGPGEGKFKPSVGLLRAVLESRHKARMFVATIAIVYCH